MKLYENITDLVGHTPLVRLRTGIPENGPRAYVKLEYVNPSGSLKDRMVLHIIRKAVSEGRLKPGDTVIDNTSGNTGSSMGMVASQFGLRAIVTTPEKTSQEKVDLIRSYGVEVIVCPTVPDHDDPVGFYSVARRLAKEKGYFDLDQYDSQDNVEAHYLSTGPELWEDTDGQITHFVAGIGTGGAFSGAAKYLKERNPEIKAIAVDPEGSVFADYIKDNRRIPGALYRVEGIGSDVVTEALHPEFVDEVITVSDKDSFNRARLIARKEGISGGGSSGSVAIAMERVAATAGPEAIIVGLFADAGIRYLSKCYNDAWMRRYGYLTELEEVQQ
ncbi:MAG: cysteine synthase family protein [candidate division Zixibacteria bacterium]|nr:cysteine synthase family protein [candidate division Zixibacteria bacterium]